jgi:hypothetical protein
MTEQLERGIEAFAPAMIKMFTGGHIGKLLVEIGPPRPSSEGTGEASKKIV